jgi:DNA-binding NtrC family response regulator
MSSEIRLLCLSGTNALSSAAAVEAQFPRLAPVFCESPQDLYARVSAPSQACVLIVGLLSDWDVFPLLETLQSLAPGTPVILWFSDITASDAVRLIRAGAFHCFDARDTFSAVAEAIDSAVLQTNSSVDVAPKLTSQSEPWRSHLIGDSPAMEAVAETIRLVGQRRSTVLITGETGTGKEMAARALHLASPRAKAPMVAMNCSAIPPHLLEAELFGHTRGAFTGAAALRIGRFEHAHQSTLFLDEIADMPLDLQAKLLRVLQEREFQRLGSSETIRVDVRVIAACNVDLLQRVRDRRFREDLYYRLNVVPLEMPPLRRRVSDIPQLVSHFIRKICQAEHLPLKRLVPEALGRLCAQPWPGNVRQLENAVEQAIAVSGTRDLLYPRDFGFASAVSSASSVARPLAEVNATPLAASDPVADPLPSVGPEPALPPNVDFTTAVSAFELAILDRALRESAGNKTLAAQRLGIKRTTLIMKLRSLREGGVSATPPPVDTPPAPYQPAAGGHALSYA